MLQIFKTIDEYNTYTSNNQELDSGILYYVEEDGEIHFATNNISGEFKIYDKANIPSGNIGITANGSNIDVKQYETATVDVPIPPEYIIPTGNIGITANGSNIDVAQYETATVDVPIPPEYIIPTGNIGITANGSNIDVRQYATATVDVPTSGGGEDYKSYIEGSATEISIPNGTTQIKEYSFYKPQYLTKVFIPESVTDIHPYTFWICPQLVDVTLESTSPPVLHQNSGIVGSMSRPFYSSNRARFYVPESAVETYKSANIWSEYASRIQAIPIT